MTQVINSNLKTIRVNPGEPTRLADAGLVYTEVRIRNISDGIRVKVAFDAQALSSDTVDLWIIPAGTTDTFFLAPNQSIFAMGESSGAQVSMQRSLSRFYTAGCL